LLENLSAYRDPNLSRLTHHYNSQYLILPPLSVKLGTHYPCSRAVFTGRGWLSF